MSTDHEWLRTKIRDILAVTSRGHSREHFLEVETLVSQMRDHLDSAAAPHLVAAVPDGAVEAAVLAERDACAKIAADFATKNYEAEAKQVRMSKRLGGFVHGEMAEIAAVELAAAGHEAEAIAYAIRARSAAPLPPKGRG